MDRDSKTEGEALRRLELQLEGLEQAARAARGSELPTLREWLELAEAWRIDRCLRQTGGNRSATARLLGIGRRTLYRKIEKLGFPRLRKP